MHRAYQLSEKQDARLENEALEEANAKESRSGSRISNISSLDNGTMVEAFKYLSYCQLAKNSLVSKRFRNVIETHRHKLAFLYVDTIRVIQTTKDCPYSFHVSKKSTTRLDHYLNILSAFSQTPAAIDNSNCGRLQCEKLEFYFNGYAQKSLNSIKDHVRSDIFQIIIPNSSAILDKQLLDFFATGSHCTSKIDVIGSHISKAVIIDFVQKFTDLKSRDGNQLIESVKGDVSAQTAEALKNNYAKFLVKEEKAEIVCIIIITHIFEFVNAVIGKKLQLAITPCFFTAQVTLKIINV